VTDRSGKILKQLPQHKQPIGETLTATFVCRLPKGTYRYVVTARDSAGNLQSITGSARLTVR